MTLTLNILRCPDGVAPETRQVTAGELSIGRGPQSDWVLPDPERVLSKRHCVVAFMNSAWQVTDTSANGTFLNHDVDRLTLEEPRALRNGDRLLLGSYEIEAAIDQDVRSAEEMPSRPGDPYSGDRLTGDPFPPLESDPLGIALPPVDLPIEFSRTTPDNLPAVAESFRPPRPSFEMLPEDWDIEPAAAIVPVAEPPSSPPSPAPVASPVPTPSSPAPAGGDEAFAAFAAGAGINAPPPADPLALLHGLGRAFRAIVSGLRRTMIARAAIKGEFRIDQTVIQAAGNNPLKFSADDEDALTALLGVGRRSDMTVERAVSEAMRDIRLHELAMATAMQQAVRDMLGKLGPDHAKRLVPGDALDFLPGRAATRRWRAYEALHRDMVQALTNDFDNVFGTSFMRAYERTMNELVAQQTE
jgi:type VI secretion system FHA domain protein